MDWSGAAEEAKQLMENSTWSPTLFHYLYVSFASLIANGDSRPSDDHLQGLLLKVTKLKKNFGGRIAFHEQLVITKARKAAKDFKSGALLPALDMMYVFNAFNIAGCDGQQLAKMVDMINETLIKVPKAVDVPNYCYLIFMKGVCHNRQNASIVAEKYFLEVIAW